MSIDPLLLQGDLVSSARDKLLTALTAAGLVGSVVGKDTTGVWASGWVFSDSGNNLAPSRDPLGTGKVAVVLSSRTSWSSNMHNTARFPVLQVLVYADPTRQAGSVSRAAEDADLKAKAVARVVRKTFHDAANKDHIWPYALEVVSSVADGDVELTDIPGSDYAVRGLQRFNLQLSDPY